MLRITKAFGSVQSISDARQPGNAAMASAGFRCGRHSVRSFGVIAEDGLGSGSRPQWYPGHPISMRRGIHWADARAEFTCWIRGESSLSREYAKLGGLHALGVWAFICIISSADRFL